MKARYMLPALLILTLALSFAAKHALSPEAKVIHAPLIDGMPECEAR
jgi:hypothetical protein